ncbi:MATE family Na+-driven efflux transporter [Rhodobacter maris]|uniref:Na+-driven multidrug efflux pump n=1 Tax=Rhodobacter maris TaxID=446682 RepID=A0A285T6Z3_9RHOB|nr:MATE family Na+-driven efflux transporter [Rhodobacter maris]SOC17155.1 Na+-driven multidrug efflux pump [Rhodobacter maris]
MFSALRQINFRLWVAIFLMALVPTLYSTVRVFFLNSLPDTWSLSIAAQSSWLGLAYEVVQEALLLPLYYLFGQAISRPSALRDRVTTALLVTLFAYATLTIGIWLGADALTRAMAQQPDLQAMTARYIRLEAIGSLIGALNDVCIVVVVALSWQRLLIGLVLLRAVLTLGFDSLFVGQFEHSLGLGVLGVGWTNIAVGACLLFPSVAILGFNRLLTLPRRQALDGWIRDWLRVAAKSGLESAARNLAFSLMILRMMNQIDEAGLFWVANSFIWGWLLLPVLTLGTLVRQDAGNHGGQLQGRLVGYLWLVGGIIVLWILTIPGWTWFVATAMASPEPARIVALVLLMLGFYMVFALNHILDSFLYGMGRTDLLLYQSLFVSIFYYGAAFGAYLTGVFEPNLQAIALLFGGGIVVDSALTLWQVRKAGYFRLAG